MSPTFLTALLLALVASVAASSSSSSDSSSSSSGSVYVQTPEPTVLVAAPPEVAAKIAAALQGKLEKIADHRAELELAARKAALAGVTHMVCEPSRELNWLYASVNGRFWDDVQDMYATGAKRYDDGMVLQLSKGAAWNSDQLRCIDEIVPNLQHEVVSIGHGAHNTGAVHLVLKYGNAVAQFSIPMTIFYEFDHVCKIAAEHYYWDPRPEHAQKLIGAIATCFDDDK